MNGVKIKLKLLRTLFVELINNIDAGNSNLSFEQQCNIIRLLSNVNIGQENEMNKTQAADYIGVCRATFDNYVKDGLIPRGKQISGFKELRWYAKDLDKCKNK